MSGQGRDSRASGDDSRQRTAGERWADEALEQLRRDRYRPRAWATFLDQSFDRASESRTARPALAAQADRWCAYGTAATAVTTALVARRRGSLAPVSTVAWCMSVAAMLRWHLGMFEGGCGERHEALTAADALTLARLFAVPLVAASRDDRILFEVVLAAGACSDALDGRFARRAGATRLGSQLDAAADMVFFGTATASAARAGFIGPAAMQALLARHALVTAATTLHYFALGRRPPTDGARVTRWASPFVTGGLFLGLHGRRRAATTTVAAISVAAVAQRISVIATRRRRDAVSAPRPAGVTVPVPVAAGTG